MEQDEGASTTTERNEALMKKIKFRSYTPRCEELKKYMEESEDVEKDYEILKSTYDAMVTEANVMFKSGGAADLEMMAPKKVNWDLKARLVPQMRLLQRQTQRALLELARENVARSGSLGRNVGNIVATRAVSDDDDDDE